MFLAVSHFVLVVSPCSHISAVTFFQYNIIITDRDEPKL